MTFSLRPYQLDAEHQARIALAGGKRRVVLYLPTGGGKTLTATSIITKATAKGRRVVFIANRKHLVAQTSAVLHRYGIEHGILQAENTCRLDARVLVASIDTIHVRGVPDDVGLLVIDECHGVAGSQKYRTLLARYNLVPVVGLTATPFAAGMATSCRHRRAAVRASCRRRDHRRTDRRRLSGRLRHLRAERARPSRRAILEGHRRRARLRAIRPRQSRRPAATPSATFAAAPGTSWRAASRPSYSLRASRTASTLPSRSPLPASSPSTSTIHDDDETRAAILDRFARGETTVLCNVGLLAEGWDCPATGA